MTETSEQQELIDEAADAPYHTVLELWQKVLQASHTSDGVKVITPQWATRITTSYPELTFQDMPAYRDVYFERIWELLDILNAVIEEDPERLGKTSAEEDRQENGPIYLTLLLDWQKAILQWELEWDCTAAAAAIKLAAAAEVHKMFFAEQGFTALLDQIQLEFTEDVRQMFADALELQRSTYMGEDESE